MLNCLATRRQGFPLTRLELLKSPKMLLKQCIMLISTFHVQFFVEPWQALMTNVHMGIETALLESPKSSQHVAQKIPRGSHSVPWYH